MTERRNGEEPGRARQLLVALAMNISSLSFGTMIGWQSPTIPRLQSANSPVGEEPMTNEAVSWLTGIACLTAAATSLLVGALANAYGRKVAACLMALPFSLCWLFTIFATDHAHLFVARFFSGMSGGMVLFLVPLYVSEIASDGIRGMLGSLLIFCLNGGILLGYVLGALLSYTAFALVGLALPLLYLACFAFAPESPVYLVRRSRLEDATRSLTWLREGNAAWVEREMARLQLEAKEVSAAGRSIQLSDLFRDRATVKGWFITLGLFGGQQLAGIFAMLSYTETIFKMSGSSLSSNTSAVVVGVIQLIGSCLSTTLVERAGRRPLLLTSCLGMAGAHFVLGLFCYLQQAGYEVARFSWISITALSVFMVAYSLGMGPGPYVVSSEILSRDVSNLVVTIAMCFVWCVAFLVVKLFPGMTETLGVHGSFFLLGFFCLTTFAFVFALLPETKGRPRQVILDRLNGISRSRELGRGESSSDVAGKNTSSPGLI